MAAKGVAVPHHLVSSRHMGDPAGAAARVAGGYAGDVLRQSISVRAMMVSGACAAAGACGSCSWPRAAPFPPCRVTWPTLKLRSCAVLRWCVVRQARLHTAVAADYEAALGHPSMAAYFGQEAVWALAARFSPNAYRWGAAGPDEGPGRNAQAEPHEDAAGS